MRRAFSVFAVSLFLLLCRSADARKLAEQPERVVAPPQGATDNPANRPGSPGFMAPADADTTWLLSSNFNGGTCDPQGWTSVDLTRQEADYWHVEHYTGLPFGPLQGFKSLWCGTRSGTDPILCQYLTLPGYGNRWNQSWCTKTCLNVSGGATGNLDVSFDIRFHTEPSYDAVSLEYTTDCTGNVGWTEIDGGNPLWTGVSQLTVNGSYPVGAAPVKVRLHFVSDSAWSDSDGLYPSNGAVHIDNLQAETLALEQFEDESAGDIASNDWQSCNSPGFGDHAVLLRGSELLQDDPCKTNISCMWAFIKDSTANYACGGHPEQTTVPYRNTRAEYIANEIWSPAIELSGPGAQINLQFDVYRDLPFDGLVFYVWHARTLVNGCPTAWRDRNFVYSSEGGFYGWYTQVEEIGTVLDTSSASHLQVALAVVDMCPFWCGVFGTGSCHSHGPLFDNVKVYRVNTNGPRWNVRAFDQFQDTFSTNGTITGTARANTAIDIKPSASPTFAPGDSTIVIYLVDRNYSSGTGTNSSGLSNDPALSAFVGRHKTKKQVYLYVAVWPLGQPGKSGAPLSEGPGGAANRYPFMGTVVAGGVTWTKIRMDYTYTGTATNPGDGNAAATDPYVQNRFNVDLNDNLFEPGDTICFFYGATSPGGTTYYSDQWHVTESIDEVASNPMEFTILPAGGYNRGGNVLYVDGADGLGNQPYFDGAFMVLGLEDEVDRYDVRGPSSGTSNRLDSRVVDVQQQLNDCYQHILWDCGALSVTLGDGSGDPEKTDDYDLLNTFLGNLTNPGGVYLTGDDVAQQLVGYSGFSATVFRATYMPFALANGNHRTAGFGVSPNVVAWPGRCFSDDFIAFGGCPQLNDFDVMQASGSSLVEMSYNTAQDANGAVVSNVNGNSRVLISGFSFASIRDDEVDGLFDRGEFIRDALNWMGAAIPPGPDAAGPVGANHLRQNYPNPFNPQTTIAFSIKHRGRVTLQAYNVAGQLVRTIVNEVRTQGAHTVTWDGRDDAGSPVASGVYFYRLVAGDFSQTRKMVLLK